MQIRIGVALAVLGILFPLAIFAFAAVAEEAPTEAKAPEVVVKGTLEIVGGHRVLTVWGTPRERGFAHGYLLADRIMAGIRYDLENVMKPLLPKYDNLVTKMVAPAFAFAPHEEDELKGLMEGVHARLPKEEVVIESLKRPVTINDVKALNTFGDWYPLACSSLAVWGERSSDGTAMAGRNFDFPGFDLLLAHQVIVVRAPCGPRHGSVSITYPGCIGSTTGMSTNGLFVSIHDVPVKPPMPVALRKNVPRLMTVRRLFEQVSGDTPLETARELASNWPSLYGNNLMVASGQAKGAAARAGVLETDFRENVDGGVTLRLAENEALCWVACTNHHRKRGGADPEQKTLRPRWRYPVLVEKVDGAPAKGKLTVDDMFSTMGAVAFPRKGVQRRVETLLEVAMRKGFGTLHQAVAETGKGLLHLKIAETGKHIRNLKSKAYDVNALVKAAGAKK